MDIPDIFARYGEAHFRDLESAAVCKAANLENHVISTGGGVVLRESNLDLLKRNGVVFCLTATTEGDLAACREWNPSSVAASPQSIWQD